MSREKNLLTLEEFDEVFWNYMPETIMNGREYETNINWIETIVYDTWRLYIKSGIDKSILLKQVENFLITTKRFGVRFEY